MKVCNKCKVEKELTEFWKSHGGKYYKSTCKPCTNIIHKEWLKTKPKYQQKYTLKWQRENKKIQQSRTVELQKSISAGIYEILYKGKRVYVGESKNPYKRIHCNHFTNFSNLDQALVNSPVAYKLSTGEIKRKDLSFNMLQYEDDKQRRLEIEHEYITQSTGLWNLQ